MAQEWDGNRGGSGSGVAFAIGLMAGAAIGVGLGLLFAPRDGAALRRDLAKRAHDLQQDATAQYERAAEAANDLTARGRELASDVASRGRDVAQRARTAVATGIREARRHATDVADAVDSTDAPAGNGRGERL